MTYTGTPHRHKLNATIIAAATQNETGQRGAPARAAWHNPHLRSDHADTLLTSLDTDTLLEALTSNSTALLAASPAGLNHILNLLDTHNNPPGDGTNIRRLDLPVHTLYQLVGPIDTVTTHMRRNAANTRKTVWAYDPRIPTTLRAGLNNNPTITNLYNAAHRINGVTFATLENELNSLPGNHHNGRYSKQLRIPALIRLLATHNPETAIALATPRPQLHLALLSSAAAAHINPDNYLHPDEHPDRHRPDYDPELLAAITNNPYLEALQEYKPDPTITYPAAVAASYRQHYPNLLPTTIAANPHPTKADVDAFVERINTADPTMNPHASTLHAPLTHNDRHEAGQQLSDLTGLTLTPTEPSPTRPAALRPHRDHHHAVIRHVRTSTRDSHTGWFQPAWCATCEDNGTTIETELADQVAVLDQQLATDTEWNLCYQLVDHFTGTAEQLADTVTHLARATRTITTRPPNPAQTPTHSR